VVDDQAGDESSYSVSPLVTPGGIALSDSEKAEALADSLETQFQPVTDPSVPAVIETVDVGLKSYFMAPAGEPKFTNPEEVQEAIRGLKVIELHVSSFPPIKEAMIPTPHGSTAPLGQGLNMVEVPRSHSDIPHSVGLLWASDQPVANLYLTTHKTITRN
jgi:hypothetical protein